MFVDLRHRYLFPVYFAAKCGLGCALLWWGQGRDLAAPNSQLKNLAYAIEHAICNAIILYADHLRKYVLRRFHKKIFVANNTLAITYSGLPPEKRESVLQSFNIYTRKNIICMGRLQRRKRVGNLIAALRHMNRPDVGLIFAGPDCDGVLVDVTDRNIYKLGPIYGDDRFDLLSAADVYCLPGAVGLSIVDAFYCGLPFVTEDGDESAEIAYLRDGENGFVVPRGDTVALSQRLLQLIDDPVLRGEFSRAARREAESNASIERLCEGFLHALQYATRQ
jgi:glycosyltransferase involved in cell wall biosynthesis